MPKEPPVYIIILNYASGEDTLEAVSSLEKLNYSNYKLVVVDNNTPTDKRIGLKEKLPEEVKFIQTGANLGFAGGNNRGVKYALEEGADYLLLLNPDVKVEPDFLDHLVSVAESPKDYPQIKQPIGFLQPLIFYAGEDSDLIYSNGGKLNWNNTFATLKDNAKHKDEINLKEEPFVSDYITGTALFVSREVIEDIGPMKEDYFLYYEDTDWSLRAQEAGYKHYIVPKARIYHKEAVSTGLHSYIHIYYNSRNGMFLGWRHNGLFGKVAVAFKSFWIFIKQPVKYFFIPKKRSWARPIMRAMVDFWRGKTGQIDR